MLYCAAADGCAPVLHDFASSETRVTHSAGAETDASACLVPAERGVKASAPSPSTPAAMRASSPPSPPPALSARTVGAAAAEGAEGAANAAAAEAEAAPAPAPAPAPPPFAGHFADPNHPGCPRSISANATAATVSGEDEDKQPWTVRASVASNTTAGLATILVDFSPKGGPEALEGLWSGASITWADGSSWELLTHATRSHCAEYQAPSASG